MCYPLYMPGIVNPNAVIGKIMRPAGISHLTHNSPINLRQGVPIPTLLISFHPVNVCCNCQSSRTERKNAASPEKYCLYQSNVQLNLTPDFSTYIYKTTVLFIHTDSALKSTCFWSSLIVSVHMVLHQVLAGLSL